MNPFRWALVSLAASLAVVVAVVGLHGASPEETSPLSGQAPAGRLLIDASERRPAPDFTGIDAWLNSPALSTAGLRGRVVLIDFWTFSCVNCVRTIPHLQALYAAEHGRGLEIVGVHSPEFDFEKDLGNVTAATRRLGVSWPVAVDSEMATWNAWSNQYWPAEYLIDQQGRVAYAHAGEGDYEQTAAAVARLLGAPAASPTGDGVVAPTPGSQISPELYAGSERGSLAGGAAYGPAGTPVAYPDPGPPGPADVIQVTGSWADHRQWLEAAGPGHVRLRFHAADLYLVAGANGGPSLTVSVSLDGAPVAAARAGPALAHGVLSVGGQGLLHVLTGVAPGDHLIDLGVPAGFQLFTVTFG